MDPRGDLRHYLRLQRSVWPEGASERFGIVYRGTADFVLQHGRWWKPTPRPADLPQGAPQKCFGNALNVAVVFGLRYVEGWALSPESNAMPVPHGWNSDESGRAIDVTWPTPGLAYLGVEFSPERADDATWNGDACVLDDWRRDWPVLRERWRGERETPDPSWVPSPALLALRAKLAGDHEEMWRQVALAEAEIAADALEAAR